jgi:hypothetical protein
VDTRTRWIIGILLALVIGLAVGLIIVAADNSKTTTMTVPLETTSTPTRSTTTETTTTETATAPNGGVTIPSPNDATTPGGGSGGL